jgi:hypothetical protein
MANDPPTSLKMGFGYRQARAAGLEGIRRDRSPRQVNLIVRDRKSEKEALEYIQGMVADDPEWKPFVEHWVREGLNAQAVVTALYNAQFRAWQRA